jgi:cobalt/nickel transport system permease protein
MKNSIPEYLLKSSSPGFVKKERAKITFLDKTVLSTAKTIKSIYLQAESADTDNFIRKINPYVKFISLIYFVVIISITGKLQAQITASVLILSLYIVARLRVTDVYRKILFLSFIFGFIVVLPASLNIITPGKIVMTIAKLDGPLHFWIYNIPQNIGITENGLHVVLLMFLRVLNSISIAMFIIYTTPFLPFIKTFKIAGVPDTFLMIITLTYKYIFILSRTIEETYFALKSRLSGNISSGSIRKLVSGRIFFIYKKSQNMYEGTYNAMVSRGYKGRLQMPVRNHFTWLDIISLVIVIAVGIAIIII